MSNPSVASSRKSHAKHETHAVTKGATANLNLATQEFADRHQMIEVAAYYKAEHRGFNGGDPMADWLQAEAEIDSMFQPDDPFNVH
jgi:hypothetical protein